MTRVALLGATGSIGRQALEVIAAQRRPRARRGDLRLDADRRARAADPGRRRPDRACSSEARPDIVLNATLGFAGLPATMWALEHGVTLALANKESLVAAGDLALAAQRARRRTR